MPPADNVRSYSAVPAWAILALERARQARPEPAWTKFERIAGAVLVVLMWRKRA